MPQNTDNHAFYLTQIHQLKELQKLDDQIYEVQQILEKAPDELRDLQDKLTKAEVQRDRINDKISHLKESESRISREREENSERLKKSKSKLMNTGNEKEFSAVTREIDNLEKMTQPREDELLAVRDELRNQNDSLNELNEQYIDLKTQVEARKATLYEQLKSAKDRRAELDRERDESSRSIPKPIFQRYEFIRQRLQHPVIVPLENYICPSCHIAIPPQDFNEMLRGEHIMSCPNCQRLIVWRDDFRADDPEALAAAKAKEMENTEGEDGSSEAE